MTQKRLYRSRDDKIIAGVAAGIADYFGVDPTLVRLIFVALLFANEIGFSLYVIAWILIPEEPGPENDKKNNKASGEDDESPIAKRVRAVASDVQNIMQERPERNRGHVIAGLILVILGIAFFLQNVWGIDVWRAFWPAVLILLGLVIILGSARKADNGQDEKGEKS